jgi:Protein of unknown function (DUF2997)
METLEFIIYPDGRVEERVTGMTGNSCAQITAAIEQKLGVVTSQELTSEYFNQLAQNSNPASVQATQSNASQW